MLKSTRTRRGRLLPPARQPGPWRRFPGTGGRARPSRASGAGGAARAGAGDDLTVALHTIDDFGRSIQHADTKAGMLTAVLGLLVGGLVNDVAGGGTLLTGSRLAGLAGGTFAVYLLCLAVAGVSLALTQMPRLTAAEECRLGFPAMAGHRKPRGRVSDDRASERSLIATDLSGEAWRHAEILAGIASTKFGYLKVAVPATGGCVAAFVCWLVISTLTAG